MTEYVKPEKFMEEMTLCFDNLGQAVSSQLKNAWQQYATTLNEQLNDPSKTIQVLPLETGTGKSVGLTKFCKLLSQYKSPEANILSRFFPENANRLCIPGILLVVRLIDDANDLARSINKEVGYEFALAHHSDSRCTDEQMSKIPILIITHQAHENARQDLIIGDAPNSRWQAFCNYLQGMRSLTVFDEAFEMIDIVKVPRASLKLILSNMDMLPTEFREERLFLEQLAQSLANFAQDEAKEQVNNAIPETLDFMSLAQEIERYLKSNPFPNSRKELTNEIGSEIKHQLRSLERLKGQTVWISRSERHIILKASLLNMPQDLRGTVVLDATARLNCRYKLLGDKVNIISTVDRCRSYNNVSLNVFETSKLGKTHLSSETGKECIAALNRELKRLANLHSKILVVCHKSVEKRIKKLSNIATAHWGAIDGKNDWADYDCVVVYGLPFLPADFEKDAIRATRNFNEQDPLVRIHDENVRAFKAGDIATCIIQAFNRIRCRKQTDIDGNCAPCSIYLALTSNELGEQIKSHIFDEMPGIKVAKWVIASANPVPTKETCETKILQHLSELSTDCISRKDVISQTGVSENSFDRFVKKVRADDVTRNRLIEACFEYVTKGAGRQKQSFFIRKDCKAA